MVAELTDCGACGKPVSRQAKTCPACGHPTRRQTSLVTWVVAAAAAVIVLIVVVVSTSTVNKNNERQADELVECVNAGRTDC